MHQISDRSHALEELLSRRQLKIGIIVNDRRARNP